jgi:hypothetical protein
MWHAQSIEAIPAAQHSRVCCDMLCWLSISQSAAPHDNITPMCLSVRSIGKSDQHLLSPPTKGYNIHSTVQKQLSPPMKGYNIHSTVQKQLSPPTLLSLATCCCSLATEDLPLLYSVVNTGPHNNKFWHQAPAGEDTGHRLWRHLHEGKRVLSKRPSTARCPCCAHIATGFLTSTPQ